MNGIIILDKPQGFTSFDGVAVLRGLAHEKKIGHTGTLDPMATGVLPILLGRAAKALNFLPDTDKEYVASFRLGERRDTGDITGQVVEESPALVSQQALEAALPPHLFRLLKFGRMESGTVRNAVSGKTVLLGSLRAFQDEVFLDLQQGLREIGQQVQADTGCQVAVHTNDGYPAVWNPDALYDRVKNLGLPFLELEKPVMISEDFSWYQRHLPALFFFLGCGPSPALHADNFAFDESILAKGAAFWKQLAGAF